MITISASYHLSKRGSKEKRDCRNRNSQMTWKTEGVKILCLLTANLEFLAFFNIAYSIFLHTVKFISFTVMVSILLTLYGMLLYA